MEKLLQKYPPSIHHKNISEDSKPTKKSQKTPKEPQDELDLHNGGLVSENLLQSEDFLRSAKSRHLKKVRIITGRGKNSPDGKPVLKPKVDSLLHELKGQGVLRKFTVHAGHFDILL